MRKLSRMIIILSVLVIAASCDVLNKKPSGNLQSIDEVFSDGTLVRSYLNTIYSYIPQYGIKYKYWSMLAVLTDDAVSATANRGSRQAKWYSGALSPTYNPLNNPRPPGMWNTNFYAHWWQGIRKANVFLAHIDKADLRDRYKSERSRYKAEARLLRAFFYMNLIKEYGGMPIITKPLPPGFNYDKLTRPSFNKVAQWIIDQCQMVIHNSDLPWRITDPNKANRFTKAVAYAIETQAALFNASPLWNPNHNMKNGNRQQRLPIMH